MHGGKREEGKEKEEKMREEGRQRGPSDTCHSWFGLWTSWPAGSQCSSTLLQCLVDSALWKITHQELTFRIREKYRRA